MFLLPLILSWAAGAVFLLLDGRRRRIARMGAVTLATVLAVDLWLLAEVVLDPAGGYEAVTGGWPAGVGIRLRVDRLSLFFAAVSSLILAVVMFHEASARERFRLFPALVAFLSAGLHGAFFTGDLFNFYVFFELAVVTSFALAAYGYGAREIRGAFVYVAVNLFGSVLFLIAVGSIYHATGTLDLDQLAGRPAADSAVLMVPAALLLTAVSVKLGLFPFHGWLPVLYGNARPAVAAAMAGALANIAAYALLRIGFGALQAARENGALLLLFLGGAAALYGGLLALRRSRPADIVAYAAIVHAGYIVLATGIGGRHGITALLLTVLSGSIDKSTLFLSLEAPGRSRALASLIVGGSIAGLPFTAGFIGKVQLFRAGFEAAAAPAVIAVLALSSLLLMAAALRLWWLSERHKLYRVSTGTASLALAGILVTLGLWPEPAVALAAAIAGAVTGEGG